MIRLPVHARSHVISSDVCYTAGTWSDSHPSKLLRDLIDGLFVCLCCVSVSDPVHVCQHVQSSQYFFPTSTACIIAHRHSRPIMDQSMSTTRTTCSNVGAIIKCLAGAVRAPISGGHTHDATGQIAHASAIISHISSTKQLALP